MHSATIARVRALAKKSIAEKVSLQLEDVIADVLALARRELVERRIMVRTEVAEDFPSVLGDRVEIQQVFLNVVMNGVDAMSALEQERRIMTICGQRRELEGKPAVLITLRDLGGGFRSRRTRMGFLNLSIHQTARHGHGVCESAVP